MRYQPSNRNGRNAWHYWHNGKRQIFACRADSPFYDAEKGRVLIDGEDVRNYPFHILRGKIGFVLQNTLLFTGTVNDNIRWGRKDATQDEIDRALKIAQAYDFVQQLPLKGGTHITQGGKNLSGGQKQRLTIARALVKSPEILILDDSASALDFATDAALRRAIKAETENMTVLIVSQRVATVRGADRIAVLDEGMLQGLGTHEELVKSCPPYREICLSQLSPEEVFGR